MQEHPNESVPPKVDLRALEEFAALALALAGARGARLEIAHEAASVGDATGSFTELPIGGVGRLQLFGGTPNGTLNLLARRIVARAEDDQAHAAALALAERANDIARSSARRFQALFEGLPIACYACDPQGGLMEWNRAAEETWGDAIAAAWGAPVASIVDPDHPEAEREILDRALAGETVRTEEREVRIGNGERRWHLASAFPLRDAADGIIGAMGARLDITRRRAAQRELADREARFRTVFEALHEGLIVVDEDGRTVLRNPSADRILRLGPDPVELVKEFPPSAVVDAEGRAVAPARWPLNVALQTGQPARDVLLGVTRPGVEGRIWISVNAEPLRRLEGEAPMGAVATFNDVTDRVRKDALIAEYAARLDDASP